MITVGRFGAPMFTGSPGAVAREPDIATHCFGSRRMAQ